MKKTIITLLLILVCTCCFAVTFTFTVAQDLYVNGSGDKFFVVKVTWTGGWYSDEEVFYSTDGTDPEADFSYSIKKGESNYLLRDGITHFTGVLVPKESPVLKVMVEDGYDIVVQQISTPEIDEKAGYPDRVKKPVITDLGAYREDPTRHVVSITSATDGASLFYTTNGVDPQANVSAQYSPSSYTTVDETVVQGVLVTVGSTVKALGTYTDLDPSVISSLKIASSSSGGDISFYFAQDLVSSVDLSSNAYTGSGYGPGKIGTVGINKKAKDKSKQDCIVSIAPASGQWLFSVMEEGIEYDMPFGIDVVPHYNTSEGGSPQTGTTVNFGIQASGSTDSPRTNSISNNNHKNGNAVSWDLFLVLDSTISGTTVTPKIGSQTYTLTESDNYTVSLIVTATYCSDTETYVVVLSGHYGVSPETTTCNISVTPLSAGSLPGLDIKALFGTGVKTAVGSYSFTTSTKARNSKSNNPGSVYIFLSSGNDGTIASNTFTLKHQNNPAKTVAYYAYLTSTDGYAHSSSSTSVQTVRFDGSTSFTAGNVTTDSLQINAHEGKTSSGYSYRWHDTGYIEIEIPANGQQTQDYINHLPSGTYYSDIYIHIVTDFNI